MAIRSIAQLKAWFKRGAYPTAEQFADWIDSFFHKEEKIPIESVDGLSDRINTKYDQTSGVELEQDVASISAALSQHSDENTAEFNAVYNTIGKIKATIPFTFDYTAYIAEGDSGPMHDVALQIYNAAQSGNPIVVNVRNVYVTVNATQIFTIETGSLNILSSDATGVSGYVDNTAFFYGFNESNLLVGTFWAIKMIFNDDMTDVQVTAIQQSSELMTEEAVRSIIPSIPEPVISDITDMFNNPSNAAISAFMKGTPSGQRVVEIYAEDTTGVDAPLVLTAAYGFGPLVGTSDTDKLMAFDSSGTPTSIDLVAETATSNGTITIPAAVKRLNGISYIIGDSGSPKKSYWVDPNGVYHSFSSADTPIANFCTSANEQSTVTINGEAVVKNDIIQLVFGENYGSVANSTPSYFCFKFDRMRFLDVSALQLNSIGNLFLQACYQLSTIVLPDVSSVTTIGSNYMCYIYNIDTLDMSRFTGLTSIGRVICEGCQGLKSILIGSVDWSEISLSSGSVDEGFNYISRINAVKIYADTQELGEAFRSKFPRLANCEIVVNS